MRESPHTPYSHTVYDHQKIVVREKKFKKFKKFKFFSLRTKTKKGEREERERENESERGDYRWIQVVRESYGDFWI